MKRILLFFLTILFFTINDLHATATVGKIMSEIEADGAIERTAVYYVSDNQTYMSGGITFTYPSGIFTTPPNVQISIEQLTPHPDDTTYTAEISANSATQTTITVYELDTLLAVVSINEAPDNVVAVHILAMGTNP